VLDRTGIKGTVNWYLWERRNWANMCNKNTGGPLDVVEPLVNEAVAGVLSEARVMCWYGR